MSNEKNPHLEDDIKNFLIGDEQKNALDFITFLRENELPIKWVDSNTGWSINYKNESISTIGIIENKLCIWFRTCDFNNDGSASDDLKETVWTHVSVQGEKCANGKGCGKCFNDVIFGKEFKNICCFPLTFFNPDAKTLEKIQMLFLLLKQSRVKI